MVGLLAASALPASIGAEAAATPAAPINLTNERRSM
jgi:hypothetical protein